MEIFNALMRIVYGNDKYTVSSKGEGVYKQCTKNKKVPCQQEAMVLKTFSANYENYDKYKIIISDVDVRLLSLLDPEKDEALVQSIIALLNTAVCDDDGTKQIGDDQDFQITATDRVSKWKLANEQLEISLSHFLLDVYLYILNNCKDNTVGEATYKEWCPKTDGDDTRRPFVKGPDASNIKSIIKVNRYINEPKNNPPPLPIKPPAKKPVFTESKSAIKVRYGEIIGEVREMVCSADKLLSINPGQAMSLYENAYNLIMSSDYQDEVMLNSINHRLTQTRTGVGDLVTVG
jgi:hypothetical protein